MKDKELRNTGQLYHPYRVVGSDWPRARELCKNFNDSRYWKDKSEFEELKKIFARVTDTMVLNAPFFCDLGENIYFGENFYANTGLTILDEAKVIFGDNVFIGPNVDIYTASHPIDKEVRALEYEKAFEVHIGNDVWIGGSTVINPGVTIGDGTVIGSGSVVTKDIPSNVIAAGNPCRVIRKITKEDSEYWKNELELYKERTECNEEI